MHLQHPGRAVVAHAGHDDAHGVFSGIAGGRAEKHVHAGPVATHQRAVLDLDVVARAAAFEEHMTVARGNERLAAQDGVAVGGFLDGDAADAVQALGKGGGELFGHVLDDDDARAVLGHGFEKFAQGLGAAGGRAHGHHPFGGLEHGLASGPGQHGVGGQLGRDLHRAGRSHLLDLGPGSGLDRVDDPDARFFQKLPGAELGLEDDVHGPVFHGPERGFRAGFGERRADDHRNRVLGHDFSQEGQPIHAGHFDVQGDDVRGLRLHALDRGIGIAGRADDLDVGVRGQDIGQGLAHQGGIVHHQDLDGLSHENLAFLSGNLISSYIPWERAGARASPCQ